MITKSIYILSRLNNFEPIYETIFSLGALRFLQNIHSFLRTILSSLSLPGLLGVFQSLLRIFLLRSLFQALLIVHHYTL